MSSTPVEKFFAQVQGTMDAVVHTCVALVSTHPEKEKVLALLAGLSTSASPSETDNEQIKSYKLGIQKVVESLAKGVETAQLAKQVRDIKKESGTH